MDFHQNALIHRFYVPPHSHGGVVPVQAGSANISCRGRRGSDLAQEEEEEERSADTFTDSLYSSVCVM